VRNNESLRRLPGFVFPPELNNEELLAALDLPDEFRDSVLARVEFAGEFVHPEARPEARRLPAIEFARDLASGVVEAATFRIGGSAWKLLTGAVAVDPGDAVVATRTFDDPDRLHAVRSFIPPFRERTGEALEFIEERFVTDLARGVPAAAAVLDDVRWYEAAKRSPSQAQRLALYVRAVERALPIAEDESWATVVERYLCEFWAFDELTNQIALVGHDVFRSLQRVDHEVLAKIPPIVVDEPDLRFRVHFPPLLENVDDLLMALEGHADLERRVLRDLQQDVASSAAVAAWLRRLRGTFVQLLRRSLRQRNAIIHGGAVAPATVASVEPFVADIAALVVANAVYALEQGKRLEDEFERERFDGLLRLERLERGVTTLDQLLAPAVAEQEGVARE
jgi:hypothetical protein